MNASPEKRPRRRILIALGVLTGVTLAAVLSVFLFLSRGQLSTQFDRIRPGMSYDEVLKLLPQEMKVSLQPRSSALPRGAVIAQHGAIVSSELQCVSFYSPFNVAAFGSVYFDAQAKVVGLYYSASGGPWKPGWGVPVE